MNDNEPMLACDRPGKSRQRARVQKARKSAADAHLILPLSITIIGVVSIAATLAGL